MNSKKGIYNPFIPFKKRANKAINITDKTLKTVSYLLHLNPVIKVFAMLW